MPLPRPRVQVVLSLLPGAEPWVLVKHQHGHFRLPAHSSALEVVEGALAKWGSTPRPSSSSETYIRVPMRLWRDLERAAGRGALPGPKP